MGVRQGPTNARKLTIAVAIGVTVIALWFIISHLRSGAGRSLPAEGRQAFYSDDDGKTWFSDSAGRIPPFLHDGKEAVAAHMAVDRNGNPYVLYLERFTPEGKRRLAGGTGAPLMDHPAVLDPHVATDIEVKAPGGKEWLKPTDPRALQIMNPNVR